MATNTTNFNLSKPEYTDTADIAVINSNMDKVDTSLQGLGTGLAIISKANTHVAITSGQYVYVHGHGSLAEGLYTAKSNISANATLSTSNLQAVSGGGLNALNSKFEGTTLPSNSNLLDAPVGVWSYASATGLSNTPCGNGLVRVYKSPSFAWTFIYVNDPTNATVTYLNIKTGSGWGGWKKYTGVSV